MQYLITTLCQTSDASNREFRPLAVSLKGMTLVVVSIDERVVEEGEWWEPEPVYKMHYQVTLEDGRELGLFMNINTGSWYEAHTHSEVVVKVRDQSVTI